MNLRRNRSNNSNTSCGPVPPLKKGPSSQLFAGNVSRSNSQSELSAVTKAKPTKISTTHSAVIEKRKSTPDYSPKSQSNFSAFAPFESYNKK
jgi:hypothetical protein